MAYEGFPGQDHHVARSRTATGISAGTAMCIGSGAAFGAMAIFGKLAYAEGVTVGTLLAVRFGLAAALFWALVARTSGFGRLRAISRRDLAIALGLGAVGYS